MAQQIFTLTPFGCGVIKQTLHQGRMFNLYQAELCGELVCLKTPAFPCSQNSYFHSEYFCHAGSEAFYGGNTWQVGSSSEEVPQLTQAEKLHFSISLLLSECQIIQWTEGAWNHNIIGQGVWDGQSPFHDRGSPTACDPKEQDQDPLFARFLPVLIMPYHRATRLADLPGVEKKKLFPRMLPALWTSLCKMYHGDLSESNLLIQPDHSHFHLIDPGVLVASSIIGPTDHWTLQDDRYHSVFTTTPANYPLLPPFDSSYLEVIASQHCSLDLQGHFKNLSDRDSHFSAPKLEPSTYGIFSLKSRQVNHPLMPPPLRARPCPSDLLALGLMYYRILTGEELFLGREILPDGPAWLGGLPGAAYFPHCQDGSIFQTYLRIADALAENYIARELEKHSLQHSQMQLLTALLNLQVRDHNHLQALTNKLS